MSALASFFGTAHTAGVFRCLSSQLQRQLVSACSMFQPNLCMRSYTKSSGPHASRHATRGQLSKAAASTVRGKTGSSTAWLQRQKTDPYVLRARQEGFLSRASFKLDWIQQKHCLLKPGHTVLDLGAAPGGWTQVALAAVGEKGLVISVDLQEMEVPGAVVLCADVTDPATLKKIRETLAQHMKSHVNVLLSDMAPSSSGHNDLDHARMLTLLEAALHIARELLAPGGSWCSKISRGGSEGEFKKELEAHFAQARFVKPPASRTDSSEIYLLATGFKGTNTADAKTGQGETKPAAAPPR